MPSNNIAEGILVKGSSGMTTPSALSKVASHYLLGAQPPLVSYKSFETSGCFSLIPAEQTDTPLVANTVKEQGRCAGYLS